MKMHTSVTIDAEPARVFDVFCDLDAAPSNIDSMAKLEVLEGPSQLNMGTRWRESRKMFGQEATEEMRVTGYEKDVSYTVEAESHGTHYRSEYTFTPVGSGIRVDVTFEGVPLTFGARVMDAIGTLFAGTAKKRMQKDLVDLKRACETV